MCGRFNQGDSVEREIQKWTKKQFTLPKKKFNIGIGDTAYIIHRGHDVSEAIFGYTKGGRFVFNGRAEGFNNKTNELNYSGKLGIHSNPVYKESFRRSRILIPVSSFIEGPEIEKLSKPFDIRLNYTDVFMLAGVADRCDKTNKLSFSIITCWTNEVIKDVVGHHRSPVILDDPDTWSDWIEEEDIDNVLGLLHPVNSDDLEIKPISPLYKSKDYTEPL